RRDHDEADGEDETAEASLAVHFCCPPRRPRTGSVIAGSTPRMPSGPRSMCTGQVLISLCQYCTAAGSLYTFATPRSALGAGAASVGATTAAAAGEATTAVAAIGAASAR